MKVDVRYYSRGGNTQKVAEAIGEAVGVIVKDCSHPINQPIDILFLGGSVYKFGISKETKEFISALDTHVVKEVALFGTSAMVKTGNKEMADLLIKKGIKVNALDFYCQGSFTLMHRGHPDREDLKKASAFGKSVLDAYKRKD